MAYQVTKDSIIGDVLDYDKDTGVFFLEMGMHCLGCPMSRGESIEEAVHREVLEEVGIKIKNLKYQRSQSWPFPNSLMLAFTAEYESGDIKVDGDEILKANWFKKDEIIRYNSDISISDWLIQDFIDKKY